MHRSALLGADCLERKRRGLVPGTQRNVLGRGTRLGLVRTKVRCSCPGGVTEVEGVATDPGWIGHACRAVGAPATGTWSTTRTNSTPCHPTTLHV
jgi:hypothetical protein